MPEFGFNIAMSIRAYGSVSVEAETAEEAKGLLTADYIADNFTPHGSGKDDLDYNHPAEIWCDGGYTEDGDDGGELGPFQVADGDWITRDPVKEAAAEMLQALREILAGSTISGRWLDASGCECEEGEEGAVFVSYNSEEQDQWIGSVAETAERAIAKAEGRTNG